jgi:hypothetical protein
MLCAMLMCALTIGCAGTPPPGPDESLLMTAGFKVVVAKTVLQKEHLQTLSPGTITAIERNGVPFFVYPDAAKSQIYVGTTKEYQAYRKLRPGTAQTSQQPADMASYMKQDTAMRKDDKRDLNDPYYFWPEFAGLDW